jgi:RHS repeat-associated protein
MAEASGTINSRNASTRNLTCHHRRADGRKVKPKLASGVINLEPHLLPARTLLSRRRRWRNRRRVRRLASARTIYNYRRDYSPEAGRYVQSDPVGLYGGLNTYAYVENQPNRYVDPNGLNGIAAVDAVAIGGICVAVCAAHQPCRDSARNLFQTLREAPVIDPHKPIPPQLPGYVDPSSTCPTTQAQACPAFREPPSPKDRCISAVNLRLGACLSSGRSSLGCHTQWLFGIMFCSAKSDDSSHSGE